MTERAGTEHAEEVAAYAAARGATLRTAQRHRKQGHPEWLEFLKEGRVPGKAVAEAPPLMSWAPMADLDEDPLVAAAMCAYNRAVEHNDASGARAAFDRVRQAREQARKDRLSAPKIDLSSGNVVPRALVLRYVQRLHGQVADALEEGLVRMGKRLAPGVAAVLVREAARAERLRLLGDLSDEDTLLAAILSCDE